MGQYLQQGSRQFFETFLEFNHPYPDDINLADFTTDFSQFSTKSLSEINQIALESTKKAHFSGSTILPDSDSAPYGISVFSLKIPVLNTENLVRLMVFFIQSCIFSCYIRGVNPYNQPGVEAYKAEMKSRLSNFPAS